MLGLSNCPYSVSKLIQRFEETLKIQQLANEKHLKKIEDDLKKLKEPDDKLKQQHQQALLHKQQITSIALQKFKQFLIDHFKQLPLEFDYPKFNFFVQFLMSDTSFQEKLSFIQQVKENLIEYIDWQAMEQETLKLLVSLNKQYGYFKELAPLQIFYSELAEKLRFIMKTLEFGHHYPNDKIFFESAYKLMALYIDEENIPESYLLLCSRMDEVFKTHSIHDSLVVALSTIPEKNKLSRFLEWQVLFHQNKGFWHVIKSFAKHAEAIEAKLTPEKKLNVQNIRETELNIDYPRASEDPDFTELCKNHNVGQETFTKCIELIKTGWPKKMHDHLPFVVVGDEQKEYFFVKLPVDDKRALILGDITECCQSIGGDSHNCVMDGITRANNGFYVLLKRIKNGNASPLLSLNPPKINHQDFRIIAQSYAWKSKTGNLCFDSFEAIDHVLKYFSTSNNNHLANRLKQLLQTFAQQIILVDPSIKRVTLGLGGKTPENLFLDSKTNDRPISRVVETMLEGFDYGDAKKQYRIATRLEMNDQHNKRLLKLIPNKAEKSKEELYGEIAILKYLLENSQNLEGSLENLERLHQDYPEFKRHLKLDNLSRLIQANFEFNWDVLYPLSPDDVAREGFNPLQLAWHLSHTEIKDWPSYLKECPTDTIKKLLLWIDENHQSLLAYATSHPESFKLFLKPLSSSEKFNITLQTDVIHNINDANQLQLLFENLNLQQKFELLTKPNQKFENALFHLIEFPEIFEELWKGLNTEQKTTMLSQVNAFGDTLLFHPHAAQNLLQELDGGQKFSLLNQVHVDMVDGLHSIAKTPEHLRALFKDLSPEQKFSLLCKTNEGNENALFYLIEYPDSLTIALQNLSASQKLKLIGQINDFDISVLFSPTLSLEALQILLKDLSCDEKFSLLMAKNLNLADVFHWIIQNPKHLPQHLDESIQPYIKESKQANVIPRILAIFAGLSAQQKFEILSKTNTNGENTLFSLIAAPEILCTLWQDLDGQQKLYLLSQVTSSGISILFHPNIECSMLELLLKDIPIEQKAKLLMAEDLDLTSSFLSISKVESHLKNHLAMLFQGLETQQKFKILYRSESYETKIYATICKEQALFQSLFGELSIEQKLMFLKKFTDFYNIACHFPDRENHLLNDFSLEQVIELAQSTFANRYYPFYYRTCENPHGLEILLEKIPVDIKFSLFSVKKRLIPPFFSLLEFAQLYPQSIKLLLKDLSCEQANILAEEKNSEGKTILELLKPNTPEYQIIVQAIKRPFHAKQGLFADNQSPQASEMLDSQNLLPK
jgi:hypothetical protein